LGAAFILDLLGFLQGGFSGGFSRSAGFQGIHPSFIFVDVEFKVLK